MTNLLGDRTCMESLRKDITDLQGTLIDVFSRVGAVRYPSWKFPDKMSCDLDLVDLMERYDYVEGDSEYTQLSHVVLLELIVDRLLLLLQSFTTYIELINSKGDLPPSRALGPSMSVGLAVRKYWSNMLKLGTVYQQVKSSVDTSARVRTTDTPRPQFGISSSKHGSQSCIANNTRTVCSQTVESSLVPCDTCAIAQRSLCEVSNAIINLCTGQNLPCSLSKMRDVLPTGRILSPTEMSYWASEESKDLTRIDKHLSELMQIICPLKDQLGATKAENEKLQKSVESCRKQLQEQKEEQQKQAQQYERKLQEKRQQNQETVDMLEKDKQELKRGSLALEERISFFKEELKDQHSTIRDLERARKELVGEMCGMVNKTEVSLLEQKMSDLKSHLESTLKKLQDSEEAMSKERARSESLQNHKESLQMKQRSLLQQLDRLAQENEDLQGTVCEAEEEKAKLVEEIAEIEREKKVLRSQLEEQQEVVKALQQEKKILEESALGVDRQLVELKQSLQEQRKREKLLALYPELQPPPEFESTGDVTQDMEKQLQANNLRITILEEENSRLRATLFKLREKSHQEPLRLWNIPHATESAGLEPQHEVKKEPCPKLNLRDTSQSSIGSIHERRVSTGGTRQMLNVLTFPPENPPISAFARAKQVKGRKWTPSSELN
ncbi:coiled-coil domain-containing protein 157-like isoform X2 [Xenopus laevis]|uniref:Coiled-coil domain-containing protein 157-like isoform X2 n=2 Tax=Xenopus laevis TaxID=8355 RepID=A0A8J1KWJ8_XENLA|nr:coiled-coil domain-containing protein 157-like isoform X2 [Xenopus laevis]